MGKRWSERKGRERRGRSGLPPKAEIGLWKCARVDAMERVSSNRCYGVSIKEYASLWQERSFIQTYNHMGVRTDGRAIETIIFDLDVHKYVIVTTFTIFEQAYVTDHNL